MRTLFGFKWGLQVLFVISTVSSFAQLSVIQTHISTVDEHALSVDGKFSSAINGRSYQKDALVSHMGFQYMAYYDQQRHVCLSRRKLPTGNWETIRFLDYPFQSNDAHNIISMGICPNDGTIHLAFDHHVDTLHYRVSRKGLATRPEQMDWDVTSFGPVLSELEKGKPIKITYPKFWPTPDGNLQFNYRRRGSGNGDRMLVDYHAATGKWTNTRPIDSAQGIFEDEMGQSDSRCSYPNGYDYDSEGRLHTTLVWRESSQGANHDLVYFFSEDQGNTWKNNQGEALTETPHVNSPGAVVYPIPRVLGLMNDHGQAIDSKGRVHVVMYHCTKATIEAAGSTPGALRWGPSEAKRYHHYWRATDGQWHHFEMDWQVGNRPKIFADKKDNLIMIFAGRADSKTQEDHPISDQRDLIIATASAEKGWKDWQIAHVVKGPFFNDMLGDFYRWKSEGILSIFTQDTPKGAHQASALSVIDFSFRMK